MNAVKKNRNRKLLFYVTLFGFTAYIGLALLRFLTDFNDWRSKSR